MFSSGEGIPDGGEEEDAPTLERVRQLAKSSVPVQRVLSVSLLVDFLADSGAAATVPRPVFLALLYDIASLPPPAPAVPPSPDSTSPRRRASSPPSVPTSASSNLSGSSATLASGAAPGASGVRTPGELRASSEAVPADQPKTQSPAAPASQASAPAGRSFSFLFSGGSLGSTFAFRFGADGGSGKKGKNAQLAAENAAAVAAVRKALCARSGDIAACLIQADPEQGYAHVHEDLLPLYEQLLQTADDWPTKTAAADAILLLATHLRAKERLERVLPIALRLSNCLEQPSLRILAVGFLHLLFDISSPVVSTHFILPQLLFLAVEDQEPAVRRCALRHVAVVSSSLDPAVFSSRVLPCFEKLLRGVGRDSRDGGLDPSVRAAAVCSLYDIAKAARLSVRLRLLPAVEELLRDPSPVVRFAAQQQLGRFLSSIGACLDPAYTEQALHREAEARLERRQKRYEDTELSLSSADALPGAAAGNAAHAPGSSASLGDAREDVDRDKGTGDEAENDGEEEKEREESKREGFCVGTSPAGERGDPGLDEDEKKLSHEREEKEERQETAEREENEEKAEREENEEKAEREENEEKEERQERQEKAEREENEEKEEREEKEEKEEREREDKLLAQVDLEVTAASVAALIKLFAQLATGDATLLDAREEETAELIRRGSRGESEKKPSFFFGAFASGATQTNATAAEHGESEGWGEPVAHSAACCAFAFAAVATAAGPRGWPLLSEAFRNLVRHHCKHVRKSIAASFHLLVAAALASPSASPPAPSVPHSSSPLSSSPSSPSSSSSSFPSRPRLVRERAFCVGPGDRGEYLLRGVSEREGEEASVGGERDPSKDGDVDKERYFLVALESLLLDGDVDIQMAVLGSIAQTIAAFSPPSRLSIIGTVVFTSEWFWSSRLLLAQQLEALFLLHDPQLRAGLLSLAFTLLQDSTAIVRKAACRCTPALLASCCKDLVAAIPPRPVPRFVHELSRLRQRSPLPNAECPSRKVCPDGREAHANGVAGTSREGEKTVAKATGDEELDGLRHLLTRGEQVSVICDILETFAESPRFAIRQLFIHMADQIIRHCPRSLFELYFMRALAYLSSDRVANVRLTWAKLLLPHLRKPNGKLKDNCLLVCAAKSLRKTERDREMRFLLDSCAFAEDEDLRMVDGLELRDFDRSSVLSGRRGSSAELGMGRLTLSRGACRSGLSSSDSSEDEADRLEDRRQEDRGAEKRGGVFSPRKTADLDQTASAASLVDASAGAAGKAMSLESDRKAGGFGELRSSRGNASAPSADAESREEPTTPETSAGMATQVEGRDSRGGELATSAVPVEKKGRQRAEGETRTQLWALGLEDTGDGVGQPGPFWSPTRAEGTEDASGAGGPSMDPTATGAGGSNEKNGTDSHTDRQGGRDEKGVSGVCGARRERAGKASQAQRGNASLDGSLEEAAEAELTAAVDEAQELTARDEKARAQGEVSVVFCPPSQRGGSPGRPSFLPFAAETREAGRDSPFRIPSSSLPQLSLESRKLPRSSLPASPASSPTWRKESGKDGGRVFVVEESTFRDKTEDTLDAIYGMPRSPQIVPAGVIGMVEETAVGRGSYWGIDSPEELKSAASADVSAVEAVEAFWGQRSDEENDRDSAGTEEHETRDET
ncbi:heat repeat family protein, related [Neospora caninum Liverpool]|uniref:Heat repeat family protein, related n=1 Tax=Neospora caninum (strain Liverpool) TaxID=572307 RepID=F0V8F1_NEOCL|nr:heat repeat family protein, related [Neospora caninum Liverpool]CBZ49992.1 heat repeat family protein, related [Neospora caninum Liverpool]|eukprot:XP_003880027.1 heat repeat family protein, related [Neospora caninum Liverpool]